jgi:2,4-dienoyl-CoA reductase-like NADH-dependent reductase (Old Yellow Enzyme family)
MAEGMSDSNHMPEDKFIQAYSQWADGGWGLIITGISYNLFLFCVSICPTF